ncbi:hypothetical protein [Spiroplasma endosymbiont of Agriotes lineatus]|uniref:hypothetical protein n=1 Tax=Spiroplasma endosymbiont of Agriotes lineatus TaxID=3077930 RepID=UPI0030CA7908
MELWQMMLLDLGLILLVFIIACLINMIFLKNKNLTKKQLQKLIPFKADVFIDYLGTINNIIESQATKTKIKIIIKDIKQVNIEKICKLKQQGIIKQSNAISIIFGKYVKALSGIINGRLNITYA